MSGPNPPETEPGEPDSGDELGHEAVESHEGPVDDSAGIAAADQTGQTDAYSRAYSAPESEHFLSGPYLPADLRLYDYDSYDESADPDDEHRAPRWPWVVGIAAIVAAIALVVSVSLLVTRADTNKLANPATTTTPSAPPPQDEITPATSTAAAPPPPTTTPAGPRQVTYSVTGTKAPGDIISVTYVDASGRSRTQHNVYIPWSMTVTPISTSDVGSVQASSLFRVSRLNCSITTSDGTVLSSNNSDSPQTSC
ncbi:MmpS family transport accessory protein [Mycobacterium terramassiliense]|uniref:MmpS3 protein n=1 Tax=Mycobacterium terramassiliense TaxID=1841859 RepID=A0A2U3NKY4_9MYCO|nr:MmpS family transport accessory protein [Mycobacterium terramassiliense]SPM32095.1 MmpS3 protein [Mycobacterium terramassiliense]